MGEGVGTCSSPARSVGCGAEGLKIFTSWSSPLVANTGMWGCGSKQFTCNKKKVSFTRK